jgi:hypothetical protein
MAAPNSECVAAAVLAAAPAAHRRRVLSTLRSFHFLHSHADEISSLSVASLPQVREELQSLWHKRASIPTPDCPELDPAMAALQAEFGDGDGGEWEGGGGAIHPDEENFQKISRSLFIKLDEHIQNMFDIAYPPEAAPSSNVSAASAAAPQSDLAAPVIEWATNIVGWNNEVLQTLDGSLQERLNQWVEMNYEPRKVAEWLRTGWRNLTYMWQSLPPSDSARRPKAQSDLLDLLRNSMCFPARVAVLTPAPASFRLPPAAVDVANESALAADIEVNRGTKA